MIYTMSCLITLGSTTIDFCNSIDITKSIESLSDEATIVLPCNIEELNNKGSRLLDHIKEGNEVTIKLGYNDHLHTEFEGYINHIEGDHQIKISCEDEMYQLRKIACENKIYGDIKLIDFAKKIVKKYNIISEIEMTLEKFVVENANAYQVLSKLEEEPFCVRSYFEDKKSLHVGFTYPDENRKVNIYTKGKNMVKDGLSYQSEEGSMKVKAVSHFKDGKKIVVEKGKGNQVRVLNFYQKEKEELETLAKAYVKRVQGSKYQGKLIGFGWPVTEAGHHLRFENEKKPEKAGTYLIDEVRIRFGSGGFRRENILTFKIS